MKHWKKVCTLMVMLFAATVPTSVVQAAPRCFPETTQCMDGRIREYWEQNGGLPVFGFPTTAQSTEVSADTNQGYPTQWMERNRFESHPENQPPYDVLLGRLGDDRLLALGRPWQREGREAGPQTGCLWFEQTGHNVCNQGGDLGFKRYWENHGLQDP